MDTNEFWSYIQTANTQSNEDMDEKCKVIETIISKMSVENAKQFRNHFTAFMEKSYSWELWGAAYFIWGGCSDDNFNDFRASLISRGKEKYNKAVSNPDTLALENYDEDTWFYEGFDYAVYETTENIIGKDEIALVAKNEPSGSEWQEEQSFFENTYPELWKKYGHEWDFSKAHIQVLSSPKPWWKFW
ncbi:DUF4240 domain-containing protein [Neptunomonas phycophila]|uniref:DUF4240 domain-containing protein n=1 Tax=Neptunomonas phycophila TaxID=1572645 RepID=UPI001BEA4950|nr:DUF4240 domain-containing protein [Neptunomonas phycophila]MBT3147130.1 DUF4240 domain-containing protein [Neptunomonas phycophila]